jgi:hypothetical protein
MPFLCYTGMTPKKNEEHRKEEVYSVVLCVIFTHDCQDLGQCYCDFSFLLMFLSPDVLYFRMNLRFYTSHKEVPYVVLDMKGIDHGFCLFPSRMINSIHQGATQSIYDETYVLFLQY